MNDNDYFFNNLNKFEWKDPTILYWLDLNLLIARTISMFSLCRLNIMWRKALKFERQGFYVHYYIYILILRFILNKRF